MALKRLTTPVTIVQDLEVRRQRIIQYIQAELTVLGVKAANHARLQREYTDRTGNLVNSTGFILLYNGVNVYEDFKQTYRGVATERATESGTVEPNVESGIATGKELAAEIAAEFRNFKGWALIVVAGMHYASSVEYLRGKNVLAATELMIREQMPPLIAKMEARINKMKV